MRDEDRPRLPDGSIPPDRMADTASLASEAMRAYNRAYVADLLAAYPNISGYGPADDFRCQLKLVAQSNDADGVWINRYGYLSDEKIEIIANACS